MGVRFDVLLVIAASGLLTFGTRVVPLVVLSRLSLPGPVIRWLKYVTIAVLAGLLAQSVALSNGEIRLPPENLAMLAAVPTLLVAARTRNLFATVLTGILVMALLRFLAGYI